MDTALVQKLADYKGSESARQLIRETPILVLVGPTGAGKDALKQRLLETGKYHHIISHTTRPPRINQGVAEQDGREYHFINKATAKAMLDNQAFIEAKIYSDNLYGTSVAEIQSAHDDSKIAMTDIEVQGVAEYKALDPSVMAVFLLPPDFHTWQDRLRARYGDTIDPVDSRRRLQTALDEIDQLLNTDYYIAVVNANLDNTFEQVEALTNSTEPVIPDQSAAREAAHHLAQDIRNYLVQTVQQ